MNRAVHDGFICRKETNQEYCTMMMRRQGKTISDSLTHHTMICGIVEMCGRGATTAGGLCDRQRNPSQLLHKLFNCGPPSARSITPRPLDRSSSMLSSTENVVVSACKYSTFRQMTPFSCVVNRRRFGSLGKPRYGG